MKELSICPLGKVWVYCLKSLKKPSIYPLGKTPSAPSEGSDGVGFYQEGPFDGLVTDTVQTQGRRVAGAFYHGVNLFVAHRDKGVCIGVGGGEVVDV